MIDQTKAFGDVAQRLARNPLGIIALFIVFLYGLASLVVVFGKSLEAWDRHLLVGFLVAFPVPVLWVFGWLVSRHSGRLYAPGDFKDERNYLKALEATRSLTLASVKTDEALSANDLRAVAEVVSRLPDGRQQSRQVLWVDDQPDNNRYERQAFEELGIALRLVRSTEEARTQISERPFAAIISDMSRPEGSREGYVLLDALRGGGDRTPFFLYTRDGDDPEHRREALRRGAEGSTARPQELFTMVVRAILGG